MVLSEVATDTSFHCISKKRMYQGQSWWNAHKNDRKQCKQLIKHKSTLQDNNTFLITENTISVHQKTTHKPTQKYPSNSFKESKSTRESRVVLGFPTKIPRFWNNFKKSHPSKVLKVKTERAWAIRAKTKVVCSVRCVRWIGPQEHQKAGRKKKKEVWRSVGAGNIQFLNQREI